MKAEQLPEIGGAYQIDRGQIEDFHRDGHLKLKSVLAPEELVTYREYLKEAVERGGAKRNCNVWCLDNAARQFVLSTRLARIAAELLDVEAVRLLRDEPYFKNAGDHNTPWHQDGYFIPLDSNIVTLWIPLTDLDSDMAPMSYATGSHKAGFMGLCGPDDESMSRFEQKVRNRGFAIHNYGSFNAGDIAAHSGKTLHSSRKNRSSRMREVLIIIYFADGARVIDTSTLPPGGPPLEVLLPGVRPGDLANGPLTPLVYSRS